MVGRAARGNPWIFRQIAAYLQDGTVLPAPEKEEIRASLVLPCIITAAAPHCSAIRAISTALTHVSLNPFLILTVTGFLTAFTTAVTTILYKNKNTESLLTIHPQEGPVSLQLFGSVLLPPCRQEYGAGGEMGYSAGPSSSRADLSFRINTR